MSYYTMSNKELSQLIRKTLKESGFASKDLSVRVSMCIVNMNMGFSKKPLPIFSQSLKWY